jgi:hypothetical protein
MRSLAERQEVEKFLATGASVSAVAAITGVPRSTVVNWWRHPDRGPRESEPSREWRPPDPPAYSYLLGLYLGDGCISAHPRGVYRLRVNLDLRYPGIVDACEDAIREINPGRRVHRLKRRSNMTGSAQFSLVEVSSYSKAWPCLFPQHGPGRKHHRLIELADWQRELVARYPEHLLRGLVHSDGCRFINTGRKWRHPRYSFSNRSEDILNIFRDTCDLMGLHSTNAGHTVYVSRKADVAVLDSCIGPKA